MNSLTKASTKRSSAATAPVAPIIPVPALTFSLLLCLSHTPRFHLASFSPPLAARPDHRQQRQRWVRRRGGQQGFGGAEERPGEEKKKKREQNWICRYGSLDICLCPLTVLFFTFPHAPSLFSSSALPLFSLECHRPESDLWWLSSVFRHTPLTLSLYLSLVFLSVYLSIFIIQPFSSLSVSASLHAVFLQTCPLPSWKMIRALAVWNAALPFFFFF